MQHCARYRLSVRVHFQAVDVLHVPNPNGLVLASRVHPAALLLETNGNDVLHDAVECVKRVLIVGRRVVDGDLLVAARSQERLVGIDRHAVDLTSIVL